MGNVVDVVRRALAKERLQLPLPGAGKTRVRHAKLAEFGREDLSFARIVEAHTDAVAILAEANRSPGTAALYGVWAAEGPGSVVELTALPGGGWRLNGSKKYCSGAPFVDAALITARFQQRSALLELPLDTPGLRIEAGTWAAAAFAETKTSTVHFSDVQLPASSLVGADDWYLTRPGFWHGAVGPAACWAGGALGLVDAARTLGRKDPHSQAQLGALEANAWAVTALLNQAGDEIDADPGDQLSVARTRALKVRHLIERLCTDTLDRFGRATGPQLLAFDAEVARRHAELGLYIRQCHAERDLQAIVASA